MARRPFLATNKEEPKSPQTNRIIENTPSVLNTTFPPWFRLGSGGFKHHIYIKLTAGQKKTGAITMTYTKKNTIELPIGQLPIGRGRVTNESHFRSPATTTHLSMDDQFVTDETDRHDWSERRNHAHQHDYEVPSFLKKTARFLGKDGDFCFFWVCLLGKDFY